MRSRSLGGGLAPCPLHQEDARTGPLVQHAVRTPDGVGHGVMEQ